MAFESHAPNLENLQSYLSREQSKKSDGGPIWWSLPSGMSSIRILPPWDPTGRIALAVNMHPIEFQGKDMKYKKYNWTCLNKTFNKPCKICEALQQMSATGVDTSKLEADRRQFYMNVIVMHDPRYEASIRAGKKPEDAEGVAPGTHVLMRTPKTLYDWIISQITNSMVGDITSLTNGIDIFVTKEGSGLGTKYIPTLSPNGKNAVPQEYLDKIEALYNLDEIFSTGFDEKLIEELITHIKKSVGVMSESIPNVVSQMAGYQPTPNNGYANPAMTPNTGNNIQPPNPYANTVTPNPYQAQGPMNMSAPNPYTTPATTAPQVPPVPPYGASDGPQYNTTPVSVPAGDNLPKCFGQYNPQNVTCVVCPAEVACSRKTNGGN